MNGDYYGTASDLVREVAVDQEDPLNCEIKAASDFAKDKLWRQHASTNFVCN
jgi:hypothetical protein